MINTIRLQNFRQHLDRTFNFTPGINAIRGDNEAGKTTILEAFAYLVFGARALRESLDDVVTYDTPVSKLRVEGSLTHLGVVYTAYRAKSGAEVTFGSERVTGQTEVTRFFERLFGVDAEMAGKLMISSQKAIAASITAGPTDAGKMIEALANFDLIDEIVELAQTKLVSGVTTGVEARIEQLRGQVADVAPDEDLTALRRAVVDAEAEQARLAVGLSDLKQNREDLDVDLAKSILADEARLQDVISTAAYELDAIDRALAVEAPIAPAPADLEKARAAVEVDKHLAKALGLHAELVTAKIEDEWDKDLASLEAEAATVQERITKASEEQAAALESVGRSDAALNQARRTAAVNIATLEGKLVKEDACPFCDKDLTDVPEVVQRNSKFGKEIELVRKVAASTDEQLTRERGEQQSIADTAGKVVAEARAYLKELQSVLARNSKVELLYARAGDLIAVDRTTVPGLWTWAGPAMTGERPNVAAALKALEARQTAAVTFEATRAAQQAQRNALKVKQSAAVAARQSLLVKDANETLVEAAEIDVKLTAAGAALEAAKTALTAAQHALNTRFELQKQAALAAELTKKQLAAAEQELVDMQSNNALIKKVRAARPVITNKLWSIVLSSSSGHFSQVRGEPSSITRDEKMFRCNGKPAAGLSRSAEDMLGLSVRISLTKTFLSSLGFLILDEPGSACSSAREASMLGMLSTLGFEQIILVTHSDLCDAYSDNMIIV